MGDYLKIVIRFRRYLEGELKRAGNPSPLPRPQWGRDKERGDGLGLLRREAMECSRCRLKYGRTNLVFGTGHPAPKLVIIGEAPGFEEDRSGEPFVGRAGELLTKMLAAIGLKREEVYITNLIKCRPPENRDPFSDEIESCLPYLLRQLSILKPSIILSLGNFATQTLLNKRGPEGITRLRGRVHTYEGIKLIPTFHPAYLLRNPHLKRAAWEDMKLLRKELIGE